jgi:hypothetical protein
MDSTPFLVLIGRDARGGRERKKERQERWAKLKIIKEALPFPRFQPLVKNFYVLPFLKTVGNLAKVSRVTFCLGCSSWVMETTPFLVLRERDRCKRGG